MKLALIAPQNAKSDALYTTTVVVLNILMNVPIKSETTNCAKNTIDPTIKKKLVICVMCDV
jgi:hypothetical protein